MIWAVTGSARSMSTTEQIYTGQFDRVFRDCRKTCHVLEVIKEVFEGDEDQLSLEMGVLG